MLKHKIISGLLFALGVLVMFLTEEPATSLETMKPIDWVSGVLIFLGIFYILILITIEKLKNKKK